MSPKLLSPDINPPLPPPPPVSLPVPPELFIFPVVTQYLILPELPLPTINPPLPPRLPLLPGTISEPLVLQQE